MSTYQTENPEDLTFRDYVKYHHVIHFENDKYEAILVRQARSTFPWPEHIKDLKDLWDDIYLTSDRLADHEAVCWAASVLWDAYQCRQGALGLPIKWSYQFDEEGYEPPSEDLAQPADPVIVWSSELETANDNI